MLELLAAAGRQLRDRRDFDHSARRLRRADLRDVEIVIADEGEILAVRRKTRVERRALRQRELAEESALAIEHVDLAGELHDDPRAVAGELEGGEAARADPLPFARCF